MYQVSWKCTSFIRLDNSGYWRIKNNLLRLQLFKYICFRTPSSKIGCHILFQTDSSLLSWYSTYKKSNWFVELDVLNSSHKSATSCYCSSSISNPFISILSVLQIGHLRSGLHSHFGMEIWRILRVQRMPFLKSISNSFIVMLCK